MRVILPKTINRKMFLKRLLVAVFILSSAASFSQDSDLGNWWIYFGNKKLGKKFNLHHEVQYRNYNAIGDLEQLLLRAGVGYNLTENNNNLLLGYGFIISQNYNAAGDKDQVNEHRIYQQYITKQNFGRFYLSHRYRLEERWVEGNFRMRFRYFLAAKLALNKPKLEKNTLYLSGYNELFINHQSSYFDRNRIYGGLGFMLNKNLKFELGYMNQIFENGSRDQVNVIMSATF